MRKIAVVLTIFLCLLGCCNALEEKFSVELTPLKKTILITETVTIRLVLKYPEGYQPDIDSFRKQLVDYSGFGPPRFSLVQETSAPAAHLANHLMEKEVVFMLSPQIPGEYFLTPERISFISHLPADSPRVFAVPPIVINVNMPPILTDLEELIEPPLPLSTRLPISLSEENRYQYMLNKRLVESQASQLQALVENKTLPAQAGIALLALIAFWVVFKVIQPQEEEVVTVVKNPDDLQQEYLKKVSQLAMKEPQRYMIDLDHALRCYFQDFYHINASSSTSQELISKITALPNIDEKMQKRLVVFLRMSDQIKFTRMQPSTDQCVEAMKMAKELVPSTSTENPHDQ